MKRRFRLLPVIIFLSAFTVSLKLGTVWQGIDGLVPPTSAQEANKPDVAPEKTAVEDGADKKADKKKVDRKKKEAVKISGWFDPAMVTDAELQILQNLSERRKQIEKRESEAAMRAGLLKATEARIDAKITKLRKIQDVIEKLLVKHNKQTDSRMKRLVKIYENMKPKDAARIFEQMDMAILLDVMERMREVKAAPIMAHMSPVKAKTVTTAMAQRRALPKPKKTADQ
jgi:flagellar motility protein MotE (MotC chaperone)